MTSPNSSPHNERPLQSGTLEETCAGGVVFKRTAKGIRIGFIRNSYKRWAFAKGHVKPGESLERAALRETSEEMGIKDLRIIEPLGCIDISYRERHRSEFHGMTVRKKIFFFLMEAPANAVVVPEKGEGISNVIWVGITRALNTSDYVNLKPMIRYVLALLRNGQHASTQQS